MGLARLGKQGRTQSDWANQRLNRSGLLFFLFFFLFYAGPGLAFWARLKQVQLESHVVTGPAQRPREL